MPGDPFAHKLNAAFVGLLPSIGSIRLDLPQGKDRHLVYQGL